MRAFVSVAFLLTFGCAEPVDMPAVTAPIGEVVEELRLSSTAFHDGDAIPVRFSCEGDNLSPPLAWTLPPTGTETLAIILDDQDAPDLDLANQSADPEAANAPEASAQWIAFNLPPTLRDLPEGVLVLEGENAVGSSEGLNRYDRTAYNGPCPPPGETHNYLLRLLALDTRLDLNSSTTTTDSLYAAARGHVLGEARMTFSYRFAGQPDADE